MLNLTDLLSSHEAWLVDRILDYAKGQSYNEFTPTLKKAWTLSIQGLTASMIEGYKVYTSIGAMLNLQDYLGLHSLDVRVSYSPQSGLPQEERLHLAAKMRIWEWELKEVC